MSEIVYLLGGPSDLTKMVVPQASARIEVPVVLGSDSVTRVPEISKITESFIRIAVYRMHHRLDSGAYVYEFCEIL
jgi:hypothetical protein